MTYSFSINQWDEKFIEEINRTNFSNMPSASFLDSIIDIDFCKSNVLYIVIGSDSGLFLPYLKKHVTGRGARVVVIEHDDVYPLVAAEYRGLLATHEADLSSNGIPLSLHSHSSWVEQVFDGSDKPWILGGSVEIIESYCSTVDYSRIYMPILQATKKSIEERVADISITLSRETFTKLQFKNAADNQVALKGNLDFGKNKVAVVLGGGPSLDLHLDWIKENRDNLFVLAVSRIANKLQKHELKPDLLISVDPQTLSYELCKTGILWTDIPLVYNYHVAAELVQQWQGPTFYLGKRLPWHTNKQTAGMVRSSGPTVSHVAVHVAANLGFSKILMTGVDMCYSQSASTHANDSPEQMIQQMPSLCNAQVETYSGRLAGTSVSLKSWALALDAIGAMVNRVEPVLYNISYEATRCQSIPFVDYKSIDLSADKPDFSQFLQPTEPSSSLADLHALEKEIKTARHAFTKMHTLAEEAKTHVVGMHKSDTIEKQRKHSNKLTRLRKDIQNDFTTYLTAILHNNGVDFAKTSGPIEFDAMTSEELIDWGQHYYDLIGDGAQSLIDHIDKLLPRIQLRRDEHSSDVEIRELAKRWRDDKTAGRILRWKQQYWQHVKPEDRAWVQRAVGKFRSTLNQPDTLVADNLSQHNSNIDTVMRSLIFLRESKSLNELQAIESKLHENEWPYSALRHYTAGLVSELEEDSASALSFFQLAIDTCSNQLADEAESLASMQRLIEDCLVRMTSAYIDAGDHQSATTTLGMLCEMLPSYIVSYAKLLHLCGQTEFSIQLLESYTELYPTNKKARLLLTELMPGSEMANIQENDPVYVGKIDGAMQAIMGDSSEQAA